MERKTYYVSVVNGDIVRQKDVTDFEFEIQATEEELNKLEELFEEKEEAENASFARAATPFKQYHNDEENDDYDSSLGDIYRMLHKLGTPETRSAIESLHLNEIKPEPRPF